MDVLKLQPVAEGGTKPTGGSGHVWDIRSYFAWLDELKSGPWSLVVIDLEKGGLLIVSYVGDRFVLKVPTYLVTHLASEAMKELFGEDVLRKREAGNPKFVSMPLASVWADAAQPVIDLLIRGFGLKAESRLQFRFLEEKAGK
jgi:hypothetical protein